MAEDKIKDFRVLFIYPNTMMATLVPMSISVLYPVLKSRGFQAELFETTYYKWEEISFEEKKMELLQVKPFSLEEKGIKYLDPSNMFKDLRNKVEKFRPNLIGITLVEDTYELGLSLLSAIKDFDIPVIAGGVFVTFSPEDAISQEDVDIICIGEGEEALLELCTKMADGEDYTNIRNLWIKKDGEIIKNPMRKVTELNKLPYVDYDIFGRERLYRPMYGKIYTMIHVELDRGCPFSCTYCEAPRIREVYRINNDNYYRRKSPERAIAEIKYLVKKYRPDYINFNAESFLAKPLEELKEFARLYKEIGLPFWCQTRPETISEEKIKILKEMNCQNLQFGLEQGNEEFRTNVLNRYYSNRQAVEGLKIVEKYGIKYTVNNIIGFPEETRELIFDTVELNRQINPSTINCYIFTPYKGTKLYNYCIEKGYLTERDKVHQLLDGARLKNQPISYEELKWLQRTFPLYVKFPKSRWDEIKIAERFDEEGDRMFQELRKGYYENYF